MGVIFQLSNYFLNLSFKYWIKIQNNNPQKHTVATEPRITPYHQIIVSKVLITFFLNCLINIPKDSKKGAVFQLLPNLFFIFLPLLHNHFEPRSRYPQILHHHNLPILLQSD